jgi:hypothetical protein
MVWSIEPCSYDLMDNYVGVVDELKRRRLMWFDAFGRISKILKNYGVKVEDQTFTPDEIEQVIDRMNRTGDNN